MLQLRQPETFKLRYDQINGDINYHPQQSTLNTIRHLYHNSMQLASALLATSRFVRRYDVEQHHHNQEQQQHHQNNTTKRTTCAKKTMNDLKIDVKAPINQGPSLTSSRNLN
jgi:hypothetical protein